MATKKELEAAKKATMIHFIEKSNTFVERATLALYERQTAGEKAAKDATEDNFKGFSGVHAEIMSSFAEWILKGKEKGIPEGKRLSEKQRLTARKILKRYTRQLNEIAEEKKAAVAS